MTVRLTRAGNHPILAPVRICRSPSMAPPTLKQQKTFALIRIIGGMASAGVLGYSFVSNVLAGAPAEGALLATGLMAFLALAYAGYYTRVLGRVAQAEQQAADKP